MPLILSRRRLLYISALALPLPALAAVPDRLQRGDEARVASVIDADTLKLEGGRADVRLVGIQGPKLPLGRRGFKTWPLAEEARAALRDMVKDRRVTLRLAATSADRHGRILAHVVRDDGLWVQEAMLRQGWARVYTFPDNRLFASELYAAEADARAARRGIWSHAAYDVRTPDPEALKRDIGTFQIIEGRVVDTARVSGRVYLNFGADYRSDFTAVIAPGVTRIFTAANLDLLALKGRMIRVRGYLRDFNGPSLDLTHPEQIETLS